MCSSKTGDGSGRPLDASEYQLEHDPMDPNANILDLRTQVDELKDKAFPDARKRSYSSSGVSDAGTAALAADT